MLILPSTTLTGAQTFVSPSKRLPRQTAAAEITLNVTSAAAGAGDTLDVFIQTSDDNGVVWDDLVHFTQVLGNGGAKQFLARWNSGIAPTVATTPAPQDGVLAAGTVVQGPKGRTWRVKGVVVSATAAVFTFGVIADLIETK